VSEELDALGDLQGVYRGRIIAESQRMKAALGALPFERPKLAVTATTDISNFASQMEEIARASGRSNVIDAKPNRTDTRRLPQPEPVVTDPSGGFKRRF
jgi:hypothetical protein